MNRFRNNLILYCCIQFLSLAAGVVYGYGEYGFVWSDTLNFNYPDLRLLTNANVQLYVDSKDEKLPDIEKLNRKRFDVNELHKALGRLSSDDKLVRNVGKGHNLVVGGITVLFRRGDSYEAFFKVLRGQDAKPLVFISGSTEKQETKSGYDYISASEQYDPGNLFMDFYDRMGLVCEHGQTEPKDVIEGVKLACDRYKTNTYGRAATALVTSFGGKAGVLKTRSPFEIKRIFHKQLEMAMEEYGKECNSPFIDSEQYLLSYLRKSSPGSRKKPNLISESVYLPVGYVNSMLSGIRGEMGALRVSNETEFDTISGELEAMLHKVKRLKSVFERGAIVGYILHIHSTNEICHCCALSLSQELVRGTTDESLAKQIDNMLLALAGADGGGGGAAAAAVAQERGKTKPFFLVLTSCSQKPYSGGAPSVVGTKSAGAAATSTVAESPADDDGGGGASSAAAASSADDAEGEKGQPHIKRMGIGEKNVIPPAWLIDGAVNIDPVLGNKLILQMHIKPN